MGNWNYTHELSDTEKYTVYGAHQKQNVNLKARGKNSGITYDLRDAFQELTQKGLLKDANGDGFTKKDALNMYKALDKVQKEKKYNTNYTHMNKGSIFDYSSSDIKKIAEAAGYRTVNKDAFKFICRTDHAGVNRKQVAPVKVKDHSKQDAAQMSAWNAKHPLQMIRYDQDSKEYYIYKFNKGQTSISRSKSVAGLF